MRRWIIRLVLAASLPPLGGLCVASPWNAEAGIELLFWRPSNCDLGYALLDPTPFKVGVEGRTSETPHGRQQLLSPTYDFGFRLRGGAVCGGCRDWIAQYTRYRGRRSNELEASGSAGLWATFGHPRYHSLPFFNPANQALVPGQLPAKARVEGRWDLDTIDGEHGVCGARGERGSLRSLVGLHYVRLKHRFYAHYQGTHFPGLQTQASAFRSQVTDCRSVWGMGPRFGIEGRFAIACGFGVAAQISVALLVGESRGDFKQTDLITPLGEMNVNQGIDETIAINYACRTLLIPYVSSRLGANYTICGPTVTLLTEIGYDFASYVRALPRSTFNDKGATSRIKCLSCRFSGPYLAVRASF